jgi:hypothetical protein
MDIIMADKKITKKPVKKPTKPVKKPTKPVKKQVLSTKRRRPTTVKYPNAVEVNGEIHFTCLICGTVFTEHVGGHIREKNFTCSKKCSDVWNTDRSYISTPLQTENTITPIPKELLMKAIEGTNKLTIIARRLKVSVNTAIRYINSTMETREFYEQQKCGVELATVEEVESALVKEAKSGNVPAIKYYLSNKGKEKGYETGKETGVTVNNNITNVIPDFSDPNILEILSKCRRT